MYTIIVFKQNIFIFVYNCVGKRSGKISTKWIRITFGIENRSGEGRKGGRRRMKRDFNNIRLF